MAKYYDWERTFSYDADVTMVIGARGVGKTFGLRRQFLRDYIKNGFRFVELVRFKNELSGVSTGYFDRVSKLKEFDGWVFRTDAHYAYAGKKGKDANAKIDWHICGYFIALTDAQKMKKKTFDNVKRIVLDEAILERSDRYHDYLPNEFGILANIVDTVSRERADTESLRPRIYLLGNACDLGNPYFAAYGIGADLKFGYRWYKNKTFLLHYVDAGGYAVEKLIGTVSGRMIAGTTEGEVSAKNEFVGISMQFVEPKPKHARFTFGIVFCGKKFGVWTDYINGFYHVTDTIPNNSEAIYYLANDDAKVNYIAAKKGSKLFKGFSEAYYAGIIRYETVDIKKGFVEVLKAFGIR